MLLPLCCLALARSGFSGSKDEASVEYLLPPLPAMRSLTVVVAWAQFGIPETRVKALQSVRIFRWQQLVVCCS